MLLENSNGTLGIFSVLLQHIVTLYLSHLHCTAIFWDKSNVVPFPQYSATFINYLYNPEDDFDEPVLEALNKGCHAFIVPSEISMQFLDAYGKGVLESTERNGARKIIIFDVEGNTNPYRNKLILEHPVFRDLPDMLIISRNKNQSYDLITTKFVGSNNHSQPRFLGSFHENLTFSHKTQLFPDKISNLEGRGLRTAVFNYKPYSVWRRVDSGGQAGVESEGEVADGTVHVDGTEMRVALEFCLKHNCTVRLVLDEVHEWGEIWDNRSGNGILGALSEGRADVGFAALYTWYHEYGFLDLSLPQVRTGITCIAPAPQLVAGWLIPTLPFSHWLWLAVFSSFILSTAAIYFINKAKSTKSSWGGAAWLVGGIYLLQPPAHRMTSPQERQMVAWILLVGLMLANAYGGGLSSVMTVPRYGPSIDTVKQLVESGLEWGATHDAWIFSILNAQQPDIVTLVGMFKTMVEEKLHQRTTTRDYAFSVERLPAGHFAIGDYITESILENLQLMKEDIYWEQCVAMTPKSSPYIMEYDKLILRIHETGLPAVWESKVVMAYLNNKVQLGVKLSNMGHHDTGPVELRPDHVLGIYILWGLGLGLATIVFIVERLLYRYQIAKLRIVK